MGMARSCRYLALGSFLLVGGSLAQGNWTIFALVALATIPAGLLLLLGWVGLGKAIGNTRRGLGARGRPILWAYLGSVAAFPASLAYMLLAFPLSWSPGAAPYFIYEPEIYGPVVVALAIVFLMASRELRPGPASAEMAMGGVVLLGTVAFAALIKWLTIASGSGLATLPWSLAAFNGVGYLIVAHAGTNPIP